MNRRQAIFVAIVVAILVVGGTPWALPGLGLMPPSNDMVQAAYSQGRANGSLYWDKDYWVAWSVPELISHEWTCRVHIDDIAGPDFISDGRYECNPWPSADWPRHGPYGSSAAGG